jgi:hypothetical protein
MNTIIVRNNPLLSVIKSSILLLFVLINLASYAHEHIDSDFTYEYEVLWKEKGIKTILNEKQSKYKFTQKEMNAFVFSNRMLFYDLQSKFWKNVGLKDSMAFNKTIANQMLSNINIEVTSRMEDFYASKTQNSELYNDIITGWESYSAPPIPPMPPTPPSPPTICENVGFEDTFIHWQAWLGDACMFDVDFSCNNFTSMDYTTLSGLGHLELITSTGYDPNVGGTNLPTLCPTGGGKSLRLENTVNGGHTAKISYTFTVDADKPVYIYKYALVLEEPLNGHHDDEKPYFLVTFYDNTADEEIECGRFKVIADANNKEFSSSKFMKVESNPTVRFTDWQSSAVDLIERVGHEITVTFVVSDCALKGHYGYVYLDGDCTKDEITIGECQEDGSREISVDGIFDDYIWDAKKIVSNNSGKKISVKSGGNVMIMRVNSNNSCNSREIFSIENCEQPSITSCGIVINDYNIGICDENNNLFNLELEFSLSDIPEHGVIKIQDGKIEHFIFLPQTNPINFTLYNLYADGLEHHIIISVYADNYMSDLASICRDTLIIEAPEPCFFPVLTGSCVDCIGSFAPIPGEKYVLSAWVKEDAAPADIQTYVNAYIEVLFTGSGPNPSAVYASGKIIDGWQRIYLEFTIPNDADLITIRLATGSGTAFFDDIRIYPINASMKSYVYDPVSLKLVAELDENNYATFYEYDQEGTLIRTKKETERGVVTITENRQSNPKK